MTNNEQVTQEAFARWHVGVPFDKTRRAASWKAGYRSALIDRGRAPESHIPTWRERCETHPKHNNGGLVTDLMIQQRMQEEIDDLRAVLRAKQ